MNDLFRAESEIRLSIPSGVTDGETMFSGFRASIRVLGRSSALPDEVPERLKRELSCLIRCEAYPVPGTEFVFENVRYVVRKTVTRRDLDNKHLCYQCLAGE